MKEREKTMRTRLAIGFLIGFGLLSGLTIGRFAGGIGHQKACASDSCGAVDCTASGSCSGNCVCGSADHAGKRTCSAPLRPTR